MDDRHVDREALEKFLADELTEEDNRALQRHVFTCACCEERLIALLPGLKARRRGRRHAAGEPPEYRELIRGTVEKAEPEVASSRSGLAQERGQAPGLWERLASHGPEERRRLIWTDPAYQTWGLFELLADRSHQILPQDVREAEDLVRLAMDVAEHLDASRYGLPAVEAAKARAWIHLGNTYRVLSDFRQTERALETAELHLSQSWLDPLDEGLLLETKAVLRRAQGRFDEALGLIETVIAIYREVNEPHLHGRALLIKGLTLQYQGDPLRAGECFRASLFLVDGAREPRIVMASQVNLLFCLQASGRSAEAAALLPEAREVVKRAGKRTDLLRLHWVSGRIAVDLSRWEEAERIFLEIRNGFLESSLVFDAALTSLDLAALYVRQGRSAEVKSLAAEMLPVFKSREVYREALAALIVFQKAAEMEQITLGLVQEISSYLQKVRTNPGLQFRGEAAS